MSLLDIATTLGVATEGKSDAEVEAASVAMLESMVLRGLGRSLDAFSLPGVEVHPAVVAFNDARTAHIAIWMQSLERVYAATQATHLVDATSNFDWLASVNEESLTELVGMFLTGMEYSTKADGYTISISAAELKVKAPSDGDHDVVFEIVIHGKITRGLTWSEGTITASERIYYDPVTSKLSSSRKVSANQNVNWAVQAGTIFGFAVPPDWSGAAMDAFASPLVAGKASGAIPTFGDKLPFPLEIFLDGVPRKLRFAVTNAQSVLARTSPNRAEFGGDSLLQNRAPTLTITRQGFHFEAVTTDMQNPTFHWAFSWLAPSSATTAIMEVPVPEESGSYVVTVKATDDASKPQATLRFDYSKENKGPNNPVHRPDKEPRRPFGDS
jgi:hypothetical protein